MTGPLDFLADDLDRRRRQRLLRQRRRLLSAQGPVVRIGGRELLNFSSNDYFNLAGHHRLARAAAIAAWKYGTGAGASPLVSGYSKPLRLLECDLAEWEGAEAALVFSSGYAANLAVLGSLPGRGDVIFSDELNHASLIDGCRLSRAAVHVYRHADLNHLEDLLKKEKGRRRFIVSDGVFSMDGDVAPLAGLHQLAEQFDAVLVLDEAHELRRQNPGDPRRVIKVGTLSKALGSQGGYVCGSRVLRDWLVNNARPYVYSTALAPPAAAAARAAIHIVREEPERAEQVLALAEMLRDRLRGLGYNPGDSECQIVPVIVGEAGVALDISRRLQSRGLLVPAIRPPSVPRGTARLRISLTAGHTQDDVGRLAEALEGIPAGGRG